MPASPGIVYWIECREKGCGYRTRAVDPDEESESLMWDDLALHEAAHPGLTSRTIKHPDSMDWIIIGDRPEVRQRPRIVQGVLFDVGGEEE